MNISHDELERLARQLCHMSGGDWGKKRTKKNLWRKRIYALVALANGDTDEARRVMS